MKHTLCGADCESCPFGENCAGCEATCGKPFGGDCVAAQYIRVGGKEAYAAFKQGLLAEINALLTANGIPQAEALHELPGSFVNLAYPLPSGQAVPFLDDTKVYLGCQVEFADLGVCYGAVADAGFLLVCRYGRDGADPELVAYQKR